MAQTAKQYSYTSASAYIYSDISVSHSGTNITVSATSHMYSGGSSYSGITRYMCLVINGTTYYNCGSRSGSFSSKTTYNSWISGSKTISVGHYGTGSVTVGVYISASSTSLSSSGTFIWNGKTSTNTSDCSLKTVSVSYAASATGCGAPGTPSLSATYIKGGSTIKLSWSAASGGTNNAVNTYYVYYSFNGGSAVYWTSTTSTSYTGTLSSLGNWRFYIKAHNTITAFTDQSSGWSSYAYTWSNVSNPSGFTVTSGNQYQTGTFYLKWTAATGGTNNAVSYYTVNGSTATSGSGGRTVTEGSSTTYTLKAVGARGDVSSGVTYTVYNPKLTFSTSAPTLSKSGVYTDALTVSWSAASKAAANDLSIKYTLQKAINGGSWSDVATGLTSTSYNATSTASWGQKVQFRVIAYLYSGSTNYRSATTSSTAQIMRGNLPNAIVSVTFNNDWYKDINKESNTHWPYDSPEEDTEYNEYIVYNGENFASANFTVSKHTKITISLGDETASTGDGTERLYINGVAYDSGISDREYIIDDIESFFGKYITSLTLKLVNVYSNTEVANGEWTISNIRVPSYIRIKTDTDDNPGIALGMLPNIANFEYNTALTIQSNLLPIVIEIGNIPYISDNATYNKNISFYMLTSADKKFWKKVELTNNDIIRNGATSEDIDIYRNGIYYPNYTNEAGQGSSSRIYEYLTCDVNLKDNRWIPYLPYGEQVTDPTNIELKTFNSNNADLLTYYYYKEDNGTEKYINTAKTWNKKFYYRMVPVDKYTIADNQVFDLDDLTNNTEIGTNFETMWNDLSHNMNIFPSLHNDGIFLKGQNDISTYAWADSGATSAVSRISKSNDNPFKNATHEIQVIAKTVSKQPDWYVKDGTTVTGPGGWVQTTQSAANKIYRHIFVAKVPEGVQLSWAANKIGNNTEVTWLTPRGGTGKWEVYGYQVNCGSSGTFNTFGFIYIQTDSTDEQTINVAYSDVFNIVDVPYVGELEIDSTAMLTFPDNPVFHSTNGPAARDVNFNNASVTSRIFNNGVSNKKSYLIFDFYAGFDSNKYYKDGSLTEARYIKENGNYYLIHTETDPCDYQMVIYTCINETNPTWMQKTINNLTLYDFTDSIPENLPTSGYVAYSDTIQNTNIRKYRGWYQLNLTNSTIDEFVKIGIRPYININSIYDFPSTITPTFNEIWLLNDSFIPSGEQSAITKVCDIWVASTQVPILVINSVNKVDNKHVNIVSQTAPHGTGSTYQFGYGSSIMQKNITPSDQQLYIDFKVQPLNESEYGPFGGTTVNISSLNASATEEVITSNAEVPQDFTLNDSKSYVFSIETDVIGSQYDIEVDDSTKVIKYKTTGGD